MSNKIFLPIVLSSALVVTACTTDPNYEKTQEGAAIGAVVGAAAGLVSGGNSKDKKRNAVIGAALGAGVGGAIGNRLDKQAAALRQQIDSDQVDIQNTGETLIVTLPQDLLFASDSAELSQGLQSDLRALATNLNEYPDGTVQVVGHTDNTGEASYNLDLSQRRANSVARVLTNNGVPPQRVQAIGAGEDSPVASNQTEEGKAQNRRVEIVIIPS